MFDVGQAISDGLDEDDGPLRPDIFVPDIAQHSTQVILHLNDQLGILTVQLSLWLEHGFHKHHTDYHNHCVTRLQGISICTHISLQEAYTQCEPVLWEAPPPNTPLMRTLPPCPNYNLVHLNFLEHAGIWICWHMKPLLLNFNSRSYLIDYIFSNYLVHSFDKIL